MLFFFEFSNFPLWLIRLIELRCVNKLLWFLTQLRCWEDGLDLTSNGLEHLNMCELNAEYNNFRSRIEPVVSVFWNFLRWNRKCPFSFPFRPFWHQNEIFYFQHKRASWCHKHKLELNGGKTIAMCRWVSPNVELSTSWSFFLSHDEQSSSQSSERCYRKTSAVVVAARKRRRERKKRKFVPAAAKHSPNTKILLPQFEIILLRNSCFPLFPNTLPPFPIPTHFDHISTLVSNVSPFTLR